MWPIHFTPCPQRAACQRSGASGRNARQLNLRKLDHHTGQFVEGLTSALYFSLSRAAQPSSDPGSNATLEDGFGRRRRPVCRTARRPY